MFNNIPKEPIKFGIYISKYHKKWAFLALTCVFFATTIDRSTVLILRNLTDALTSKTVVFDHIWLWAITYPIVLFIAECTWRGSGFMGMRWFLNYRATAYQALFEYLSLHSKEYFSSRFAGSLTNKIANAVDGTETIFDEALWQFIPLGIGLIWYIGYAWSADYRLGLIIAIWSVFFLSINVFFSKKLQPSSYKSAEALSALKGRIVDSLSNISLVHEYANTTGERSYIKSFVFRHRDASITAWTLSEWILVINGVFIFIFASSMVATSIYLFQSHIISVGVIVMVIAIVSSLTDQFLFIGQQMRDATKYYGQAREGLVEILHEHIIVNEQNAKRVAIKYGTIDLDNVSFNYEEKNVFKDFTLHSPAGQKVGLVGRSGSGKTTLVSLLLRHFDIQEGTIQIEENDISKITLDSLRSAIAFVPQDTSLFHRTVRDNIRYSDAKATDEQVKRAAKLSQADDFIRDLPKGYDTLVGERGVKLSGGQRQRVAIARAFLKDAPIVILDEATSSLDSQSEHAIQESIETLMEKRTVIAIAHRLSTLKSMDRIVVIEHGKILEDGTPDVLLKNPNGHFKKMWDHQINGFIIDD